MSKIYDNWEKLVGVVLRREKDRQLARCESFESLSSSDLSSRFSCEISFTGDVHQPAAGAEVSRSSCQKIDRSDHSSSNIFFSCNVRAIKYEEIRKIARYFRSGYVLGEGSSTVVYKGWIDENSLTAMKPGLGIPVAVKIKTMRNSEDVTVQKKWMEEISHRRHPNLVTPIGYCFNSEKTILVYEFMHEGRLENHLFRRWLQPLPWATRIKVAVGAARALAFLHNLEKPITYGILDIHHIFLDCDFNPKLSDLGLPESDPRKYYKYDIEVPFGIMNQSKFSPYAAPEYKETGQLSTKCDVYSFGVVLVQLLSGLRAFDRNWAAEKSTLIDWTTPYLGDEKTLWEIMDSRLEGEYPYEQACKIAQLALQCVSSDPISRPSMDEVVAVLQTSVIS